MLDVFAEVRIVPGESIHDQVLGDLVDGAWTRTWWGDQVLTDRRTDPDGALHFDLLVPSDHPLGEVRVRFEYDGNDVHEGADLTVVYTVVSDTFVELEDREVLKGDWVTISGRLLDDRSRPVSNARVHILWKRAPEIGWAITGSDGRFSMAYYVEYEDRVGNVTVIARFEGGHAHMAGEGRATYTVMSRTVLERRDRTFNLLTGEPLRITSKLHEDWGGYRGREMSRELVTLTLDGEVVDRRRTAFDGSVTFTLPDWSDILEGGLVDVVVSFDGTDHYQASRNMTTVFIRVPHHFSTEVEVGGRPFDAGEDVARLNDTVHGRVTVKNGSLEPWPGREVSVHYTEDVRSSSRTLVFDGVTDERGQVEFLHILRGERGGKVHFGISSPGMVDVLWYSMDYLVPPPPTDGDLFDVDGDVSVAVGSTLHLDVSVRRRDEWDLDGSTFALVSPPEGMVISPEGTITWEPAGDQLGDHAVIVWVFDGERNEAQVVHITVEEPRGATCLALPVLAVSSLVILMFVAVKRRAARRRA